MYPRIFYVLQLMLQRCLLLIPRLSEGRVAVAKTMAFLKAWHFLSRTGVRGDYLEFGVFEGSSFDLSLRCARKFFDPTLPDAPRFFGFDSFEGLPEPDALRDSKIFKKGEYSAGKDRFFKTIARSRSGWSVEAIGGYFEDSLKPALLQTHRLQTAAFVNFDSDLYPSTLEALRFVAPLLQTGTIFFFDDWYSPKGDASLGEAGACADWLKENPNISLVPYGDVGVLSRLFIVNKR